MKTFFTLAAWLSLASAAGAQSQVQLLEALKIHPNPAWQIQVPGSFTGQNIFPPHPVETQQKPATFANAVTVDGKIPSVSKGGEPPAGQLATLTPEQISRLAEIQMNRIHDLHAHEKWQIERIHKTYESQAAISTGLFWALSAMTLLSLGLCLFQFAQGLRQNCLQTMPLHQT